MLQASQLNFAFYNWQNISSRFRDLTDKWKDVDRIKVYHGSQSFRLQTKKRTGKVEIHKGWMQLRNNLKLSRNDICLFHKKESCRRYDLVIYRKGL